MPRYRKPEAKKQLAGTYRRDRAKRRPKINGMTTVPPPPEHLTAQARSEWHRLAPRICEQRTMAAADLAGFEMLCEVLSTITQAQTQIARDGLTIGSVRGGKCRTHPAVKILESSRAQATRLLIEYGLTPRAREHVQPAADPTPDNAFARLG